MKNVVAIVVAAGQGRRMGAGKNKVFLNIGDGTILEKTLLIFERASLVNNIIVVAAKEELGEVESLLETLDIEKVQAVIAGGKSRQESVFAGLLATKDSEKWVLIHDGARPMLSSQNVDEFIECLFEKKALVMAIPVVDTIKQVENGLVKGTLQRNKLWRIQTPQGFLRNQLIEVHKKACSEGYEATDDSGLMEWAKKKVYIYEGKADNIKITQPEDLLWASWRIKQKK